MVLTCDWDVFPLLVLRFGIFWYWYHEQYSNSGWLDDLRYSYVTGVVDFSTWEWIHTSELPFYHVQSCA